MRYIEQHTIPLFQRGLPHNPGLGVALGESGIYAKITLDALRRIDGNHEEYFFGSESQIRTGDQRIMIPLL